ncbi:MAG: peptidogalycan biosysnthesis protein [Desulfovibrio sp.]|jgi:predicted N-acyltransferase|nr:peptidogalycan biosysnthesis protein [Desulfovibrio sp.]
MDKDLRNSLEPPALADLFLRHPPEGFTAGVTPEGLPFFHTGFDLLTTFDREALKRLQRLPLFRLWSKALRVQACFAGTTVSEYAPLPRGLEAEALLSAALREGEGAALTIIKDLPASSPLLSPEDNAFSAALSERALAGSFMEVDGQALAYVPVDFTNVEQCLDRLSAARRKDLRRKWKTREKVALKVLPLGDDLFSSRAFLDELYGMYLEVFAQSHMHFDLLDREFFAALLQSGMPGAVLCYYAESTLAGYNICLIHDGRLIDKYIGFRYPLARELNLYFISWLVNLEFALERGLHTYVAGWTDPEVKAALGARFTFTRHLVYVRNPLLRGLLRPFRRFFEGDRRSLEAGA